jgi:hypothetical protein
MTIYDVLKDATDVNSVLQGLYAKSEWQQVIGAIRIGLGCSASDSRAILTAEQVANVCKSAGYATVESLSNAVTNKSVDFVTLANRKPVHNAMLKTVDHNFLRDAVQKTAGYCAASNVRWFQRDVKYKLMDKVQLNNILLYVTDRSKLYYSESMDCDDFQRELLGWLSSKGLGNMSIGACSTLHFNSAGEAIGGHAGCVVVYADSGITTAKYLEPMTGKLHNFNDTSIGGFFGVSKIEVYDIGF